MRGFERTVPDDAALTAGSLGQQAEADDSERAGDGECGEDADFAVAKHLGVSVGEVGDEEGDT